MTLPRVLLVVLTLTALAAVGGGVLAAVGREPPHPPVASRPASGEEQVRLGQAAAVEVLHTWDVRRAAAWSHGDVSQLRALYVTGSRASARDAMMLRSWVDRGLAVRGMRMQLLGARVRVRTRHRIVIEVTDRLTGAVAVGFGTSVPLPRDTASTRTVTLRRMAGEWRVASVSQASAVASTAVTSRSPNS